jgi:hypothetical protein
MGPKGPLEICSRLNTVIEAYKVLEARTCTIGDYSIKLWKPELIQNGMENIWIKMNLTIILYYNQIKKDQGQGRDNLGFT